MKTINTFITLVILSVFFTACVNDEQKALNYIKTEVLPEESIENYLLTYNVKNYCNEFWNNLGTYLNNVCGPNPNGDKACKIYLNYGYGHYYTLPSSGDRRCVDWWTFGNRHGFLDSQKILQSIHDQVSETITSVLKSDTINQFESRSGEFDCYEEDMCYNAILYEAVNFRGFHTSAWKDRMALDGIENTPENIDRYKYEWTVKTTKQQQDFIISLSRYLVKNARAIVRSNEYKLIDVQSIKISETNYHVIYLLKPQLKIIFDVSKVGKSFCCDAINIDGAINWNMIEGNGNEDDLI